jgi:spermidine/putrescine-binding protein
MLRQALTLVGILALVGVGATAGAQAAWTCPTGYAGQTLSVYNWTTYVADDTIANFEAACGVRVIYDTYPSDDDMLARMRQGNPGYDVAVPSDRIVAIMVEEDLLLPLDRELLPNWVHLDPPSSTSTTTPATASRSRTSGARSASGTTAAGWASRSTAGWTCSPTTDPSAGSRTSAR